MAALTASFFTASFVITSHPTTICILADSIWTTSHASTTCRSYSIRV